MTDSSLFISVCCHLSFVSFILFHELQLIWILLILQSYSLCFKHAGWFYSFHFSCIYSLWNEQCLYNFPVWWQRVNGLSFWNFIDFISLWICWFEKARHTLKQTVYFIFALSRRDFILLLLDRNLGHPISTTYFKPSSFSLLTLHSWK